MVGDPNYWTIIYNKGVCHYKLGQIDNAKEEFKNAADNQAENAAHHDSYGLTLFDKGMYEEAIHAFSRAIQNDAEPHHYSHRGLAYYKVGRNEEALIEFNCAIEK